jgi:hypothetical protein
MSVYCELVIGKKARNEARNERLTLAIGECWHNGKPVAHRTNSGGFQVDCSCGVSSNWSKFGDEIKWSRVNFSSWDGFGFLWKWVSKQPWFATFLQWRPEHRSCLVVEELIRYVDPDRFADAVDVFLEEMKTKSSQPDVFKIIAVESGFCRIAYKTKNAEKKSIFYCIAQSGLAANGVYAYRCSKDGEPSHRVDISLALFEVPLGKTQIEIIVRNSILKEKGAR